MQASILTFVLPASLAYWWRRWIHMFPSIPNKPKSTTTSLHSTGQHTSIWATSSSRNAPLGLTGSYDLTFSSDKSETKACGTAWHWHACMRGKNSGRATIPYARFRDKTGSIGSECRLQSGGDMWLTVDGLDSEGECCLTTIAALGYLGDKTPEKHIPPCCLSIIRFNE